MARMMILHKLPLKSFLYILPWEGGVGPLFPMSHLWLSKCHQLDSDNAGVLCIHAMSPSTSNIPYAGGRKQRAIGLTMPALYHAGIASALGEPPMVAAKPVL